uniref:Reverse transcriptase zinc-binding domain-containing protein n=1 Tax=Fagus sylvatica TaxID=28930 RepID=A0A2N9HU89_FAGSY
MLIWRIASNVLPTKANLAHRMGGTALSCPVCKQEDETIIHLFYKCPISRAIWFSNPWSLHSDAFLVTNHKELAMLVIDPPIIPSTSTPIKSLKEQSTIQLALTIDTIWQLRNQQEHSDVQLNFFSTIKTLETKIWEQIKMVETTVGERVRTAPRWSTPPQGTIKLNVDAAMLNQLAALAVVARYSIGVLKAWTKIVPLNDVLMAEAAATLWAVEIAKSEGY